MPDLWLPGIPRMDTGRRLVMRNNNDACIFTHHSFEAPYSFSPDCVAAARYLRTQKSDPHFVFHPITGALIQMLPANTGGRTLRAKDPVTGRSASTNTWGKVHMQVETIAFASRPWTLDLTEDGRRGLEKLVNFLRSWGIPDRWCHNIRPPKYPGPGVKKIQPVESGHFHHAGWVVNNHGDPGAIANPWDFVPTTPKEDDEMSQEQYDILNKKLDETLNILNHHIRNELSPEEKANWGTSRNLSLASRINLIGSRVNTLRERQWGVLKSSDATTKVVEILKKNGVDLSDQAVTEIASAFREALKEE